MAKSVATSRARFSRLLFVGFLAAWPAMICAGQEPMSMVSSGTAVLVPADEAGRGDLVREIDDPVNGRRWLLFRDANHPGGPGLLVLAGGASGGDRNRAGSGDFSVENRLRMPVIHPGDRVVAEEDSRFVEARLEAFALGPAAAGEPVRVRLRLGGQVLSARAIAPGRVRIPPAGERRP